MNSRTERVFRRAVASVAWSALGLQFYLTISLAARNGDGAWVGVSRYFGYFTILTNLLVALVLSAAFIPGRFGAWLSSVKLKAAVATYMAIVGIVYTLVLRSRWDPVGLQQIVDIVLHDVVPVSVLAYWLFFVDRGSLSWTSVVYWLSYPLLYFLYVLACGAVSGWYPYPFIDAGQLGYARTLLDAAGLLVAFALAGLVVVGLDKALSPARGQS